MALFSLNGQIDRDGGVAGVGRDPAVTGTHRFNDPSPQNRVGTSDGIMAVRLSGGVIGLLIVTGKRGSRGSSQSHAFCCDYLRTSANPAAPDPVVTNVTVANFTVFCEARLSQVRLSQVRRRHRIDYRKLDLYVDLILTSKRNHRS